MFIGGQTHFNPRWCGFSKTQKNLHCRDLHAPTVRTINTRFGTLYVPSRRDGEFQGRTAPSLI